MISGEVELAEPLRIVAELSFTGVEDDRRLLEVGRLVCLDLLVRQLRPQRVLVARVADQRR